MELEAGLRMHDFFGRKIVAVKRVKSERKTKKRNVILVSGIISGKTITEDALLEKVIEGEQREKPSNE